MTLGLLFVCAGADDAFFEQKKETWFYYAKDEVTDDDNVTVEPTSTMRQKEDELIENIPWEKLDQLSAKEFSTLITSVKEIAVMRPDQKNVSAYIRLQKYATDQSSRFMNAWQVATIEDPTLTDNLPVSKRLRDVKKRSAREENENFARNMAERGTLVLFYSEADMATAKGQLYEYDVLKRLYGFEFRAIAIEKNTKYADALELSVYPDNWFYYKEDDGSMSWRRIGAGGRSAPELISNMKVLMEHSN
jgi:glucan-binding YG repeat protein